MNKYEITHELTLIFDDAYGHSGFPHTRVIDLSVAEQGTGLSLGTFTYDIGPDPELEILLYTKSYEFIKKCHPHLPYTLLYTFVHEMVHYEQFRDHGGCGHYCIDNRIEQLMREFNT